MKSLPTKNLKANLMKAIEQIKRGKSIVITAQGNKVVSTTDKHEAKAAIKALRKTAIIGDVVSPIIIESWDAD